MALQHTGVAIDKPTKKLPGGRRLAAMACGFATRGKSPFEAL